MSTPHPVQFKGSALARWMLARMGWTVQFEGLPSLQGVIAVYPHTSNWDFIVGIVAKWAIGIPAYFWAKDSLRGRPGAASKRRPSTAPWRSVLPVDGPMRGSSSAPKNCSPARALPNGSGWPSPAARRSTRSLRK